MKMDEAYDHAISKLLHQRGRGYAIATSAIIQDRITLNSILGSVDSGSDCIEQDQSRLESWINEPWNFMDLLFSCMLSPNRDQPGSRGQHLCFELLKHYSPPNYGSEYFVMKEIGLMALNTPNYQLGWSAIQTALEYSQDEKDLEVMKEYQQRCWDQPLLTKEQHIDYDPKEFVLDFGFKLKMLPEGSEFIESMVNPTSVLHQHFDKIIVLSDPVFFETTRAVMMVLGVKAHYLFVDQPSDERMSVAHVDALQLCVDSELSVDSCLVFTDFAVPATGLWHTRLVASLSGLSGVDWDWFFLGRHSANCDMDEHISEYLIRPHYWITSELFAYGYKRSSAQFVLSQSRKDQKLSVLIANLVQSGRIRAFAASPNVFKTYKTQECYNIRESWIKSQEAQPWDPEIVSFACASLGDYIFHGDKIKGDCQSDDFELEKWICEEALSLLDRKSPKREKVLRYLEEVNRELTAMQKSESSEK